MADDKDKKIGEVPHLEQVTGNEKIPVSADGQPRYIKVEQIKEGSEKEVSIVSASGATLQAEVGKYYRFDEGVNTLEVTLPRIEDKTKLQSFVLSFTTGDEPAVTIGGEEEVSYFEGYSIEANTTYELNLMYNGVKWIVAYGTVEG